MNKRLSEINSKPQKSFILLILILLSSLTFYGIRKKSEIGAWNVDDYLYGMQVMNIGNPFEVFSWAMNILGTGQNAPLFPTLASLIPRDYTSLVTYNLIQIPILIALFFTVYQFAKVIKIKSPLGITAITLTIPTFVNWSVMLHFALISTLFFISTLCFYLINVNFSRIRISVLFGISIGLLSLTRSVSLVLVLVILCCITAHQIILQKLPSFRGVIAAIISSLIVAGPWWYTSGKTVLTYLIGMGYPSSEGSRLSFNFWVNFSNRIQAVAIDIGVVGCFWIIVLFVGVVLKVKFSNMKRTKVEYLDYFQTHNVSIFLSLIVVVGFTSLMSSMNRGTGFFLPIFPVTILVLTKMSGVRFALEMKKGIFTIALIGIQIVLTFSSLDPLANRNLQTPPPYLDNLKQAGWLPGLTSTSTVNERVSRIIGSYQTVIVRDDAWVNSNAIGFYSLRNGVIPNIRSAPYNFPEWLPTESDLLDDPIFVLGTSPWPYHWNYNQEAISVYLMDRGYTMNCGIELRSNINTVQLWSRNVKLLNCL